MKQTKSSMKPVLIVERCTSELSASITKDEYLLSGIFTEFDVLNRNERVYTPPKFLPCLNEFNERKEMLKGAIYGEFDHPEVFDLSMKNISHAIKEAKYNEEKNRVDGKILLLDTFYGNQAQAIVKKGLPLFVSSRAAGITEANGHVTLKKLITWDIVADPGFPNAVMGLNESVNHKVSKKANYRIYDLKDETKFNELLMNDGNKYVTEQTLQDYTKYVTSEITKLAKEKNPNQKKMAQLIEEYQLLKESFEEYKENLQETLTKMPQYLDYLADKVQVVVNENKELKGNVAKLSSELEKSINYQKYVAENLDKTINFADHLAEMTNKSIEYTEYVSENLGKSVKYIEYIAENLSKNIEYGNYLATNVEKTIKYSEYLGEQVSGNLAYCEYLAENLDDSIDYADYVGSKVNKNLEYTKLISEALTSNKISEGITLPSIEEFSKLNEDLDEISDKVEDTTQDTKKSEISDLGAGDECEPCGDTTDKEDDEHDYSTNESIESDEDLDKKIDSLIAAAKIKNVAEKADLHFLTLLNKQQVNDFYSLSEEDQELVKTHLHENKNNYQSRTQVLMLIQEAVSMKSESLEDKLIRLIPESVKASWERLDEKAQTSILSQARLFPNLNDEETIENFWLTRNLRINESFGKKVLNSEPKVIEQDKLSDDLVNSILEKFKKY